MKANVGIKRIVEESRQLFRRPENLLHYDETDYQEAERKFVKFMLESGGVYGLGLHPVAPLQGGNMAKYANRRAKKIPSTKFQISNKHQAPNHNIQTRTKAFLG